jgi:hypothetical protein
MNKYDQANLAALKRIQVIIRESYPYPEDAEAEFPDLTLALGIILGTAEYAIREIEKELKS